LTPLYSIGSTIPFPIGERLTVGSLGCTSVGKDGPYISTSSSPTRPPRRANSYAKLTAMVDFPTPPYRKNSKHEIISLCTRETLLGPILYLAAVDGEKVSDFCQPGP
jgi:hypothetical protein